MGGGDREGLDASRQDKLDKVRRMDLIRAFLASFIDGLLSYTHHRDYYRTNFIIVLQSLHSLYVSPVKKTRVLPCSCASRSSLCSLRHSDAYDLSARILPAEKKCFEDDGELSDKEGND